MRVTIEHREERVGLLKRGRAFFVDCTADFSEHEKAIIGARRLEQHYVEMPKGFEGVLDPTETRRLYGLKLAVAAAVAFLSLLVGGGTGWGALLFVSCSGYSLFCLYRTLSAQSAPVPRLEIGFIQTHRRFTVQCPNPARAKEVEHQLLDAIARMKNFLEGSAELAPRTVHEF